MIFKNRPFRLGYSFMVIVLLANTADGVAWAHGIHGPEGHTHPSPAPDTQATILDYLMPSATAAATFRISEQDGYRYIEADGLPQHSTGSFPNRGNPHSIKRQSYALRLPLSPKKNIRPTPLGHNPFGIALNGVMFDPLTAEYWRNDRSNGWNLDAFGGGMNLGIDRNNAHVQPDGAYHYHGIPVGLVERLSTQGAPTPILLGYAADGFPIYAPTAADTSSYRLKSGTRPSGPGGQYDGTYTADWEYVAGQGTLDICNGREGITPEYPTGTYYYVLTDTYPFIPRCLMATPDDSFQRHPGGGGGQRGTRDGQRSTRDGPETRGAGGNQQRGRPDLNAAAQKLGISVQELRRALGPPPPDFNAAAQKLGISAQELRKAMHGQ